MKFHPNDPDFFRNLIARGYDVRLLGGTPIATAFAGQAGAAPELLDVNAESVRTFLERLDVFVYRKHPAFFETGGTAVLEAMAMELPVVMFPEQCGIAEIIRDNENGFFVDSEAQAIEVIDRLALDRALRARVGRAARASVVALMREQQPRLFDFYLGTRTRRTAGTARRAGGNVGSTGRAAPRQAAQPTPATSRAERSVHAARVAGAYRVASVFLGALAGDRRRAPLEFPRLRIQSDAERDILGVVVRRAHCLQLGFDEFVERKGDRPSGATVPVR